MQVLISPIVVVYQLLAFTIGITAVLFIALVLWLDRTPKETPLALPERPLSKTILRSRRTSR